MWGQQKHTKKVMCVVFTHSDAVLIIKKYNNQREGYISFFRIIIYFNKYFFILSNIIFKNMTIYYNNRFALKCAFLASRIMTCTLVQIYSPPSYDVVSRMAI